MAKTRQQKEATLSDLASRLAQAKSLVFAQVQKLSMKELEELRHLCREQEVGLLVSKKTLLKKALSDRGLAIDTEAFAGGVSTLFGLDDEMAPARIIAAFAKGHEKVDIFGGVLEGAVIDAGKVKTLSDLPSRLQLLGHLVGTIQAPISGFVNVLAGNLRGLLTVLSAIGKSKSM